MQFYHPLNTPGLAQVHVSVALALAQDQAFSGARRQHRARC